MRDFYLILFAILLISPALADPITVSGSSDPYLSVVLYGSHCCGGNAITTPVDSVLGVFLDNAQPSQLFPPSDPNGLMPGFSFSPEFKPVFFIRHGLTGEESGPVEEFLGTRDDFAWHVDSEDFPATGEESGLKTIVTVTEPSSLLLIATSLFCLALVQRQK